MAKSARVPPKPSREAESETSGAISADDVAAYISQMTRELAAMAGRAGLGHLAFILGMANLEAGNPARKSIDLMN
jgi:hypothetical protein